MIAQLVDRHLVRRDDQLPIARPADFQRHALLQVVQMTGRNAVEADEFDGRHPNRLALRNRDRHIDGVLLVVQLDVESGDPRVGIAAIGVKRLDALEIGVEAGPVEIRLPAPRQLRALPRGQHAFQPRLIHRLHPLESEAAHGDRAFFPAGAARHGDQDETKAQEVRRMWLKQRTTTRATCVRRGISEMGRGGRRHQTCGEGAGRPARVAGSRGAAGANAGTRAATPYSV